MIQKLNTVVNSHNWEENMSLEVEQLNPVRWKVSALKKYSAWLFPLAAVELAIDHGIIGHT